MSGIQFTALEQRGLWACERCGAAVNLRDQHADWHERVTTQFASLAQIVLLGADASALTSLTDAQREQLQAALEAGR